MRWRLIFSSDFCSSSSDSSSYYPLNSIQSPLSLLRRSTTSGRNERLTPYGRLPKGKWQSTTTVKDRAMLLSYPSALALAFFIRIANLLKVF